MVGIELLYENENIKSKLQFKFENVRHNEGVPCIGPCSNLFGGLTERSLSEQARRMPPPSSSLSKTFDEIRPPLLATVDNNTHTHALSYDFFSILGSHLSFVVIYSPPLAVL